MKPVALLRAGQSLLNSHFSLPASQSPTGFDHAGDLTLEGQLPETDTAHSKFAQVGARPTTELAAVIGPDLEFRRPHLFGNHGFFGHLIPS
jgi:hypothetical protein